MRPLPSSSRASRRRAPAQAPALRRLASRLACIPVLALSLALSVALSLGGAGPAAAQGLRLAVSRGPVSLPVYVAQARGYFAEEGLVLQLSDCSSGRDCLEQMEAGRADVATAAELLMTLRALQGSNSAIVATISASSRAIKLLARRSAGIAAADDLRGKRVASVAGTSAQYFLDSWLLFHAIDRAELSLSALPPPQLLPALQRRDVDALAIWEPLAAQAVAAIGADAVVLPAPRVYTQHFSLIASRQTIEQRRAELSRLLRALLAAERFIAQQPQQAAQLLAARLQTPGGTEALAEHSFALVLPQSLIATMDAQARWAVQGGTVAAPARPVNLLHNIDPSLLRELAPAAVGLSH